MAKFQLTFNPTYQDYLTVNRATTFNKPTLVLIGLMTLTTIITLVGWLIGWLTVDPNQLLFFVLPPALFVFFMVYTTINLHQHARQKANQTLAITWHLDCSGISIIEDGHSQNYSWDQFSIAQELDAYYLLFLKSSPSDHFFLPKSAFADMSQEQHFCKLVGLNLGMIK